jgi:hypothetical protein
VRICSTGKLAAMGTRSWPTAIRRATSSQNTEKEIAAANATAARKHTGIAFQLLLANEGTSAEEGQSEAVRQIGNLEGPDRIVAVAGMGLSTASTENAATALSAVSMPMFGAVTTGDQFDGDVYQGFFQIVPDVDAQVRTLASRLRLATPQPVALISSDQKSRHAGKTLTVLYAGREASLPVLVGQFQQASVCAGRTVTIVTGSDSNALPASVTDESDSPGADVTIVYSDIESVANLSQDFVTGARPPTPEPGNPRLHGRERHLLIGVGSACCAAVTGHRHHARLQPRRDCLRFARRVSGSPRPRRGQGMSWMLCSARSVACRATVR